MKRTNQFNYYIHANRFNRTNKQIRDYKNDNVWGAIILGIAILVVIGVSTLWAWGII